MYGADDGVEPPAGVVTLPTGVALSPAVDDEAPGLVDKLGVDESVGAGL